VGCPAKNLAVPGIFVEEAAITDGGIGHGCFPFFFELMLKMIFAVHSKKFNLEIDLRQPPHYKGETYIPCAGL
jgi:hypothetical protein